MALYITIISSKVQPKVPHWIPKGHWTVLNIVYIIVWNSILSGIWTHVVGYKSFYRSSVQLFSNKYIATTRPNRDKSQTDITHLLVEPRQCLGDWKSPDLRLVSRHELVLVVVRIWSQVNCLSPSVSPPENNINGLSKFLYGQRPTDNDP